MKTLIAYFSAEGTTAALAEKLAEEIGADVFEIRPQKIYTQADINWKNPMSRCNKEKFGKKDVPVEGSVENFEEYSVTEDIGNEAAKSAKIYQYEPEYNVMKVAEDSAHYGDSKNNQ